GDARLRADGAGRAPAPRGAEGPRDRALCGGLRGRFGVGPAGPRRRASAPADGAAPRRRGGRGDGGVPGAAAPPRGAPARDRRPRRMGARTPARAVPPGARMIRFAHPEAFLLLVLALGLTRRRFL